MWTYLLVAPLWLFRGSNVGEGRAGQGTVGVVMVSDGQWRSVKVSEGQWRSVTVSDGP